MHEVLVDPVVIPVTVVTPAPAEYMSTGAQSSVGAIIWIPGMDGVETTAIIAANTRAMRSHVFIVWQLLMILFIDIYGGLRDFELRSFAAFSTMRQVHCLDGGARRSLKHHGFILRHVGAVFVDTRLAAAPTPICDSWKPPIRCTEMCQSQVPLNPLSAVLILMMLAMLIARFYEWGIERMICLPSVEILR